MVINSHFPNWFSANIMIENFIDLFGVYVTKSNSNYGNDLHISFLPQEVFYSIPEEDRQTFNEIYNNFLKWLTKEIDFESIFKKYEYLPSTSDTLVKLESDLSNEIKYLENKKNIQLKKVLSSYFGV